MNLAFDAAGNLLVVSYAGNGTVYALAPGAPGDEPALLAPQPAAARPGLTAILPVGDWRLQTDAQGGLLAADRTTTSSPDGRTFVSATQGFVDGATSWGVKSSDLIRAFGLQRARPGERVYLTSEAEVATWSALRGRRRRPHATCGSSSTRAGRASPPTPTGNVYIAAGDVLVYDPSGTLVDTIRVPERPTQLVFGGPDGRTLFIPARDALYAVRTRAPGR